MLKSLAEFFSFFFFLRKLAIAGIIISCCYELLLIRQNAIHCYGFLYGQRNYKIILVQAGLSFGSDFSMCVTRVDMYSYLTMIFRIHTVTEEYI